MADVKISELPAGVANVNAVVPATNAAGNLTEKITLGDIAALAANVVTLEGLGAAPANHTHAYATQQDINTAIGNLVDSAPQTLNTLNELAQALNDDASFATTVTTAIAGKADAVHTHAIADVTNLQSSLDGKASSSHTHAISDVTNLQTSLDSKAATSHSHAIADVTNLQTSLDGKAASSHTHAIADVTGLQASLDGKAAASHTHAISDVTNLQTTLNGKVGSNTTQAGGGTAITNIVTLTQAQYDAIAQKDANTLYLVQ